MLPQATDPPHATPDRCTLSPDRILLYALLSQVLGFVHGVLNTDNMSIMGLTIDYGPFGFLEHFDPDYTPNGSDGTARYTYENQPSVCRWNLLKLAEMLDPLLPLAQAKEILARYDEVYDELYMSFMRAKLGLLTRQTAAGNDDKQLVSY